ncbi:MAG: DUF983 domain-containing protein [Pelagimonas sp.]
MAPTTPKNDTRPLGPSLHRGWRLRCPRCGSGPMLAGYLKVRDHCPVCREELYHQKAGDTPAYLTLILVAIIMAPLLNVIFASYRPDPLILFTIFAVGCVGLSLYLLPKFKGVIVAYQWARELHGFARS